MLVLVGVLFAPGCLANPSSSIKDAVARALEISKQQSALADIHANLSESSTGTACPLTKFHNRQLPTAADVTADRSMLTMMAALRMLREQGFSLKDLESDIVLGEFARELAELPGFPYTTASCTAGDRFRSVNGTCNNLRNPTWGMAGAVQRRLLPAAYDDGYNHPRTQGADGSPLPSARKVSNAVHLGPRGVSDPGLTLHVFQFGQFLDHDVISTPVTSSLKDCCANNDDLDNCFNINFAEDDPHQPRFKAGYCMEVKRSSGVNCKSPSNNTSNMPGLQRQQINKVTSFIDASNVYGSSEEQLQGLRDGTTPFMRVVEGADGPRLPDGDDSTCNAKPSEGIHCSLAGDDRVNFIPSLTSFHNVFFLEHNRLARRLREEFPDDEDELFQQTRKLMIAIMQKIVYDEFLPSFLSPAAMKKFKLTLLSPIAYLPNLDPTISNEFGIAYSNPEDVDLFTGALSETPVQGGDLGPTMECIIGDQFHRLKYGDRFFYQNKKTGFTKEQQAAIANYSLASLMCRNYNFGEIHFPNIFRSDQIPILTNCEGIDDIDLTPFSPPSFPDPDDKIDDEDSAR